MTSAAGRVERISRRPRLSWTDARTRLIVWQIVVVALLCAVGAALVFQAATNLKLRGITSGYDYLGRSAGFEIARGWLSYSSRDSYARALAVGLINTLRVSLLGIAAATALGVVVGVARLSNIRVVSTTARAYVELLRNTPLLLQLLFWYALSQALPDTHHALHPLPGVFLSERGLFLPGVIWQGNALRFGGAALLLAILGTAIVVKSRTRRERTGVGLPTASLLAALLAVVLSAAFVIDRRSVTIEPALGVYDFRGGTSVTPEFAALLIGLSTYTAAFIGEIVRGGILAVDRGQSEAARALGLTRGQVLRLVVLPQALRLIVPPTTTQYLNLLKNSSLAVAIGYPELISITSTTLNQTGQAIEAIVLVSIVYLVIGLAISAGMNLQHAELAGHAPGRWNR